MKVCDFCNIHCNATAPEIIYDGPTRYGAWAWMCEEHWMQYRRSAQLGTGYGQKFDQSSGVLTKLEG